jgi:hypothetical protein
MQPRGGQAQIGGNMPIPSDGTTFSYNIKEDGNAIRTNGERPRWICNWKAYDSFIMSWNLSIELYAQKCLLWYSYCVLLLQFNFVVFWNYM